MNIRTALSSRPRNFLVASLAAAALALTACQGGGEPVAQPTLAETSSATAAPSTSTPSPAATATYKPADASGKAQNVPVPVKPALADENSKEGLEAFTKYWFELLSYGYETGDVTEWQALSAPDCSYCVNVRKRIDDSYSSGGWQVGAKISVGSVEPQFMPDAPSQEVAVQVLQQPTSYYAPDGSEAKTASSAGNSAVVVIATYDQSWSVDAMHPLR